MLAWHTVSATDVAPTVPGFPYPRVRALDRADDPQTRSLPGGLQLLSTS